MPKRNPEKPKKRNPTVQPTFDPKTMKRVVEAANAEGMTLAGWAEYHLRRVLDARRDARPQSEGFRYVECEVPVILYTRIESLLKDAGGTMPEFMVLLLREVGVDRLESDIARIAGRGKPPEGTHRVAWLGEGVAP